MAVSDILEVLANRDHPFTTIDVCRLAGCTYRQLDYWVRTGLITSPRINGLGSGRQREWETVNVVEAVIISRLSRVGIRVGKLRDTDVFDLAESLMEDLRDVVELATLLREINPEPEEDLLGDVFGAIRSLVADASHI